MYTVRIRVVNDKKRSVMTGGTNREVSDDGWHNREVSDDGWHNREIKDDQ